MGPLGPRAGRRLDPSPLRSPAAGRPPERPAAGQHRCRRRRASERSNAVSRILASPKCAGQLGVSHWESRRKCAIKGMRHNALRGSLPPVSASAPERGVAINRCRYMQRRPDCTGTTCTCSCSYAKCDGGRVLRTAVLTSWAGSMVGLAPSDRRERGARGGSSVTVGKRQRAQTRSPSAAAP